MKLFSILFLIIIFFNACDDKVVTKSYIKDEINLNIESIELFCVYPNIKDKVILAIKNSDIKIKKDSNYTIKVDYTDYKKACNNPMTSAYDRTFDGFIRLTLLKNNTRIYMCQKEFRGELSVSDFEKLLTLMRDELEF